MNDVKVNHLSNNAYQQLSNQHNHGPVPDEFCKFTQYGQVKMWNFDLNLSRDKCIQIGRHVGVIKNILKMDDGVIIVYQAFCFF